TLTRDGITAYVAGGLGNQLFIAAAAWEQAQRLGCPLYFDASTYEVNKLHPYGLDPLGLPSLRLTASQSPSQTRRVPPGPHFAMPARCPRRVYIERSIQHYSAKINNVRPGPTLLGYFHSPRYFSTVREPLLQHLWNVAETPEETAVIDDFRLRPAVTLHL